MKRPSLALVALLSSLAVGLVAMGPRQARAATYGVRFCAIEIVAPPRDDDEALCPDCPWAHELAEEAPHVCTPPGTPSPVDEYDRAPVKAAVEQLDEAAMADEQVELNAADTSDVPDDQSSWENEYGQYYGDFFTHEEEYNDGYASQYDDAEPEVVIERAAEPTVVEETPAEEPDFRYGDGYNPWQPVTRDVDAAPGPEDLIVEEATSAVEPYDLYGRQVGDEYYGYDYEPAPQATDEVDYGYEYEYEYDYESSDNREVEATPPTPPVSNDEAEVATETYYEEYYPDYYAELYGSDESAEAPVPEPTEYDAAYDEALFGEPAEGAVEDMPVDAILDELIDPTPTADDLPWADESPEVVKRPALESEYGSDYADEYYRALFGEEAGEVEHDATEEEEVEALEPAFDGDYDFFHYPCHAGECRRTPALDVTRLVVACGQQVMALTESLELVSMRLHSACVQLAELPTESETK